jgi:hypothetical protein
MADKKISELTAATTVGTADLLVLVQGGNTLKIDVNTFLLNLPTRTVILEAQESLSASGAVATNKLYTEVSSAGSAVNLTLAAGTHGMRKEIVATSLGAGVVTLTVTSGRNFTTITWPASVAGGWARLVNVNGFWYAEVGGKAASLPTIA